MLKEQHLLEMDFLFLFLHFFTITFDVFLLNKIINFFGKKTLTPKLLIGIVCVKLVCANAVTKGTMASFSHFSYRICDLSSCL